ncbi:MAG: HPF/RaiA family ribosome-associated protein [Bdellovibrionia bacterium]
MEVPIRITFKNLSRSDAFVAYIHELVDRLHRFYPKLISLQVMLEMPHRRHHKGNLYWVRVILRVPGADLVAKASKKALIPYRDLRVAIQSAFLAVRRDLEDHLRRQRGKTKRHAAASTATVVRLIPGRGEYGFLQTPDGREVYFHSHSVLNDQYGALREGSQVRFQEEKGEFGPQASTVELLPERSGPRQIPIQEK